MVQDCALFHQEAVPAKAVTVPSALVILLCKGVFFT